MPQYINRIAEVRLSVYLTVPLCSSRKAPRRKMGERKSCSTWRGNPGKVGNFVATRMGLSPSQLMSQLLSPQERPRDYVTIGIVKAMRS
jgi:hypothetical protein